MNDEIERAMDEYTASQRHRVIKMGGNAEEIAELRQQLEAERERARQAEETLGSIRIYGSDTLSGRVDGPNDAKWYRDAVREMRNRARDGFSLLAQQKDK